MKSMERAKSFVAARPTSSNNNQFRNVICSNRDVVKHSLEVDSLPKRSNSVCGAHSTAMDQIPKMVHVVEEAMLLKDSSAGLKFFITFLDTMCMHIYVGEQSFPLN